MARESPPPDVPGTASELAADRDAAREAVLDWYAEVHRDLPWRRTDDPYAILVSEVMLQQTQVARVVPRFEAWIDRWPTAADLAAADRRDVLGAWVGLGYNSRAVRLQDACAVVARDGWPEDARGLRALPGVGPYTAAAVASFAFGERIAAVDTNVVRISERLGLGGPDELLPADDRVPTWNQAAMELGAVVCRARSADCPRCPAARWCRSAGRVVVPPRAPSGSRTRFEDTDRYVRGRIVASLAGDEPWPDGIGPERLERALDGLVRDGLVTRTAAGPVLRGSGDDG
ncbi:A/G-specific adenine glycosylase [Patulibacter sp.]|uniref:A/G-specific adenine glycosylase n=1 Tax=Patulibacter sp. TaxID=1912859 RepID=UPI0027165BAA|nr:A/G-specific adenine glycosylase [Patulibacter sp.]MDO9407491.1 A/G-specific adenine glycosylase [Patulibacter sp.]